MLRSNQLSYIAKNRNYSQKFGLLARACTGASVHPAAAARRAGLGFLTFS
jgi:hypothetical protein